MIMSFWTDTWLPFIFSSHNAIKPPRPVKLLNPYERQSVQDVCNIYYQKYFGDEGKRTVLLGINPGRLGAGITGISFTDAEKLERYCDIPNSFDKKEELSSKFIYNWITQEGNVETFYRDFIILSVCPLGFVRDGKNINYYDQPDLMKRSEKLIIQQQDLLVNHHKIEKTVYMLGKGKNFKYFKSLNEKHKWYNEVKPLPHPRWVMQYKYHSRHEIMRDMMAELFNKSDS